jgi:amino acid transporter
MSNDSLPPDEPGPAKPEDSHAIVRLTRPRDRQSAPEPELRQTLRGSLPGSRRVRITRERDQTLRRVGEGEFEATQVAMRPATKFGRLAMSVRRVLIGAPIASSQASHERLSKLKALAIFSSDNLSSSAYASEEILLVLILAGTGALSFSIPIAFGIAALAAIVATSYVQLVRAYPGGGGAYQVTSTNLGMTASLLAGSTLFVDYILTVAVSTAAGVAAITSAVPELVSARIEIAVGFVALLTVGNLRGIRESGSLFAIPPYIFILSFGGMIAVGLVRVAIGDDFDTTASVDAFEEGTQAVTLFLLLRAFASGAAALTGIEAIADGTPSFKPPEARNASITLIWMACILALLFIGTTILAHQLDIVPAHDKTVVAQIAERVLGGGVPFYIVQVATAMILVLAANTAFAGLPILASVMARDGVMPKQFAFRGDRLAFSNGIIVLGILSSCVLVAFSADTHKIIPLYAFGVFMAFTLSQAGMVIHWRRTRERGWRFALILNAVGMIVTGVVALIVGGTKFTGGAWLSMSAMGLLFLVLWRIHSHYEDANEQLGRGLSGATEVAQLFYGASAGRPQTVIVPVEDIDRAVLRTLAYARTISQGAVAVHVVEDHEAGERFRRDWEQSIPDVPLVIVESPYRSLVEPLLAYIDGMERTTPNHVITVVLPEFVPRHIWQKFLHNQLSARLKDDLIKRPNTAIIEVPFHFH